MSKGWYGERKRHRLARLKSARIKRMQKALKHSNKRGAGAKARAKLARPEKIAVVMMEFKRGTLHSGSGKIVKKRPQAIAIALSEARKGR